MTLLEVQDLEVVFPLGRRTLRALHRVSFTLDRGERLGVVGESGAGKSVAAFSILNLISRPGRITGGRILYEGRDLTRLSEPQLREIRGNRIAMIFQDPMMTLNPVLTIETQLVETLRAHRTISKREARRIAVEKLKEVRIPSPEARLGGYPHELSGGMRQRVVIAAALLTDPAIIIADEPTTALDVTIQAEIMALMVDLCRTRDVALMLITHDLAVVSQVAQRVIVMYAGEVVEEGSVREVIYSPRHPYTRGLLAALPQRNKPGGLLNQIPGSMPTLDGIPEGCSFHPRCERAEAECARRAPLLREIGGSRRVACHFAEAEDGS